jgi:hypothetical protein
MIRPLRARRLHSASTRAALRATGQIGLLTYGLGGAANFITRMPIGSESEDTTHSIITATALLYWAPLLLSLVTFWTSIREFRERATNVLCGLTIGTLAAFLVAYHSLLPRFSLMFLLWQLSAILWVAGAVTALHLSYRGKPLGLSEDSTSLVHSPWMRVLFLPLFGLTFVFDWVKEASGWPALELTAALLLTSGMLYGLMRRLHPRPESAGWLTPTLILITLTLPSYAASLISALDTGMDVEITQHTIACSVVAIFIAALVALRVVEHRRGGQLEMPSLRTQRDAA